jgi:hypothetical protein
MQCRPSDFNRHALRRRPARFPCASRNHKDTNIGVANAGACLSTMEKRCFCIATSLELATCLHAQNTSGRGAGCLTSVAYGHPALWPISVRHRKHHCCSRVQQSPFRLVIGDRDGLGSNADVIPGGDRHATWLAWWKGNRHLRFFLVSASASAVTRLETHLIRLSSG